MKLKTFKWILLISAIGISGLHAQHLNIRNYSIEDGLVQSQVHAIVQDDDGYLWFGTGEGLSKFDGREFVNFNRNDGIAANFIESGFKDHDGNLWFGHFNGRVTKYHRASKKFENISLYPEIEKVSKAPIYKIFEDFDNDLWFVTNGRGLFHLRQDSIINLTTEDGLLSNTLSDIIQFPDSCYWISTSRGINILRKNKKMHSYICDTLKLNPFYPDISVQSLFLDSRNNIWIEAGSSGIYRIKIKDQQLDDNNINFYDQSLGFTTKDIGNIIEDYKGDIWVSTIDQGVFHIAIDLEDQDSISINHITQKNGLSSDFLITIFEDSEHNLWIGSDGSGVSQLRDFGIEVYNKSAGLVNECVWTIHEDSNGKIWVGHDLGMSCLDFIDKADEKFAIENYTHFNGNPINHVLYIAEDQANNIWFFSLTHEPIVLDYKTQQMNIISLEKKYGFKDAMVMLVDSKENIWYGSRTNGILKIDTKTSEFNHYIQKNQRLSSDIINTIYQDSKKRIWFGTENGGLMCFNGKDFDVFNSETGYPINSAVSITEDSLGGIWFLSSEDKLYRLYNNEIEPIQGIQGVDGKTIYSVCANNNDLWIGTTNGLCKVLLPEMKTIHFGLRGGYPIFEANEDATFKDRHGNLWFGTIKGVVKIIPNYQKTFINIPLPDISKIQVFLQDVPIPQDRKFEYNQNHITFHFRSICLTAPEQVKYKYFLRGFDDHWSPEITNDYVTYSNLNPGQYMFEVMACNAAGDWSQASAQFGFEIKTPFWKSWWFYFFPVLIIGFLIYFYILQRIRSIEKSKLILENRVKLRTRELQEEKTKFEEANRALLAEKERLVVTLRSIGEGVIATDEHGKITMINSAAESICELSCDDAMGKSLSGVFPLIHKKTGERIIDPVDRIKESGELFSSPYNNVLVTKRGIYKNVSYSGSPIRDKDSQIMGIVIVFRDITDQLKMEKELIKNQKLESLGVLAGGIAHDFNNLLTAVTGNISLSKIMLSEDHEMYHRLDLAEKASDRARDLIQQLMTFSKGGTPVKQTTSILELVKETTEFVLRGSKVKYEMDFPEDLHPVDVDPGQMNQVIHNIILNAHQAMLKGGTIKISAINKTITSRSRVPLKPGNYIRLNIEDNGPGIKPSFKHRIFDPFFTTKTNGSGLGLASAFSIIKRHQGFITVESELGRGSTFKIYLPATSNKIKSTKTPDTIDYKGKGKILVMDDENFVRDTASDMISFFGFDVVCVKDGTEVLKEYKTAHKNRDPYNAVILDLTIPGGMGGELAVKKLLNFDPNVTAIVASGYSTDPIMANYSSYGFKARLTKPYNLQEVGNVLRSTVRN